MTKLLRNPWLLGAAGVVLAWLNVGVDVAGPDQQLYVPYIRHFAHPELYPGDYIFASDNYRATLWVPLVGTLHRVLGGDLVPLLYVVHFASLFLLFAGAAALTARIARGAAPAWVVVFVSWPPPIPGTAAALWEPSPNPRTLAVALALWAMRFAVDAREVPAALLAAAAVLVHPLLGAAPLVGGVIAAFASDDRRRALARYLGVAGGALLAARLVWPMQHTELPWTAPAWWRDVATADFLWCQHWTAAIWLSLVIWCALFVVGARHAPDAATRRARNFALGAAPLCIGAFVGMAMHAPLLVALQLHRSLFLVVAAAVVLVARRLADDVAEGRLPAPLFAAVALLPWTHSLVFPFAGLALCLAWAVRPPRARWLGWIGAAACVAAVVARRLPHRLHAPAGDWIALQRWAAHATPVDLRFLTPLRAPDFRVLSARAVVVGAQDQQPAIFNHAFADAWQARRHAVDAYATRDCAALTHTARQFAAGAIVTDFDCALPLLHREGQFRIYDARMAAR